jgi:hypothetical protein
MTDTITLTDSIVKNAVPEDRTEIVLREAGGFALGVRGGS